MTHICVSKLTIIGSDNGLAPSRRQAIISTNAGILLIRPSGTNFSEILIEIMTFSFKKMNLKLSSAKCRPFCRGLNVLTRYKLQTSMPFTIIDHVLDCVTCGIGTIPRESSQVAYDWSQVVFYSWIDFDRHCKRIMLQFLHAIWRGGLYKAIIINKIGIRNCTIVFRICEKVEHNSIRALQ